MGDTIQTKTLEYLDLHEVLEQVEKTSKRPGLEARVWENLAVSKPLRKPFLISLLKASNGFLDGRK